MALSLGCDTNDDGQETPQPRVPSIDPTDSPTSTNPILLEGDGEGGATLQVRGGADPVASVLVGATGRYTVEVRLVPNAVNNLRISQVRDGVEGPAKTLTIEHDNLPPLTPEMDASTSPTRRTRVTLSGRTEANAAMRVAGGREEAMGAADAEGRFSIEVELNTQIAEITQNDLMVFASDAANNESAGAIVAIVHNPNLPVEAPELDPLPQATNQPTIAVSGLTEPNLAISIAGGAEVAETTADANGTFSVDVSLRANSVNTLSAFAIITATGLSSPARTVTIEHDDVLPDAPYLYPTGSPTGATIVSLAGSSEANVEILAAGGASPATAFADMNGFFNIEVPLTLDAVNTIEVRARDLAGNEGPAATVSVEQDSSLEAPVRVNAVPSPTVQNPIELSGSAEATVSIRIEGGVAPIDVDTDANGQFSVQVELTPNTTNTLRVFRLGSTVETLVTIEHDDIAPDAPQLDAIASPTNQTVITVNGTSEPNAHISITGGVSAVNGMAGAAGRFSIQVQIPEDQTTTLDVIATDRAGNTSLATTAMVEHSSTVPDAPILDDTSPDPTNEATYVVTGRISSPGPGITIEISGGAQLAMGPTDALTGSFSVEVSLNANVSNQLEVRSIEGEIVSPPALVAIVHDDQAPTAPDGNRITVGSPSLPCVGGPIESIGVTGGAGAVEGFAHVSVSNLTRNNIQGSANAAQDGAFSARVLACSGDVIRLNATDAAGNTSQPTELTVQ